MKYETVVNGKVARLDFNGARVRYQTEAGASAEFEYSCAEAGGSRWSVLVEGRSYSAELLAGGEVSVNGRVFGVDITDPRAVSGRRRATGGEGRQAIAAPMPGRVIRLLVEAGAEVQAGQGLIVVEAMKMQNEMKSPKAGRIVEVKTAAGDTVTAARLRQRIGIAGDVSHGQQDNNFTVNGANQLGADLSVGELIALCLSENDRRLGIYDKRLKRPRFVPFLVRQALNGGLPAEELAGARIHEVLDLCVECKACQSECSSGVDVAKVKYEVLNAYHEVHGLPLRAWLFGHLATWSRLLSRLGPALHRLDMQVAHLGEPLRRGHHATGDAPAHHHDELLADLARVAVVLLIDAVELDELLVIGGKLIAAGRDGRSDVARERRDGGLDDFVVSWLCLLLSCNHKLVNYF